MWRVNKGASEGLSWNGVLMAEVRGCHWRWVKVVIGGSVGLLVGGLWRVNKEVEWMVPMVGDGYYRGIIVMKGDVLLIGRRMGYRYW